MTTRRAFLAAMIASVAAPRLSWADAGSPSFLAAAREPDQSYSLYGLDTLGNDIFRIPLPDRGHAGAAHPTAPEVVGFARRPGTFALVIDCVAGRVMQELHTPPDRVFCGHGMFIGDGDILCTSEIDVPGVRGVLGLWSRREGYRRIGEIATHGVGPHEAIELADGTLLVANGGYHSDPARLGEKLFVEQMHPNLVYLSPEGELLEKVELDPALRMNSIRHVATRPDGLVAFAMQWQLEPNAAAPLMGLHRRGQKPVLAHADLGEQVSMKAYVGSIAFDETQTLIGITSPRGGRLHIFDDTGAFRATHLRADICGLTAGPGGFIATDGQGGVWQASPERFVPRHRSARNWDHHVVTL